MHLESSILIERPPDRVWAYLGDVSNLAKWDRGVARVSQGPAGVTEVGSEFDTIADTAVPADDGSASGRMSYRITEVNAERQQCTVELTSRDCNARYFKTASWILRTLPAEGGTLLTCSVEFALRLRWLVLAPVLWLTRRAITRDLIALKKELESATTPPIKPSEG
jgi:hypothetical protein